VTALPDGAERLSLRIDATKCRGIGMCAYLVPSLIDVDDWGYPVLPRQPLGGAEVRRARAAVAACPRLALFVARP
jgi:ferredoxin